MATDVQQVEQDVDADPVPDGREMAQDAATVAAAVWTQIDKETVNASRDLDKEFASAIGAAAYTDTVSSFMDRLAGKMGVRTLDRRFPVMDVVDRYDGEGSGDAAAFLKTVRGNKALVVLEMHEVLDRFFEDVETGDRDGTDDDTDGDEQ